MLQHHMVPHSKHSLTGTHRASQQRPACTRAVTPAHAAAPGCAFRRSSCRVTCYLQPQGGSAAETEALKQQQPRQRPQQTGAGADVSICSRLNNSSSSAGGISKGEEQLLLDSEGDASAAASAAAMVSFLSAYGLTHTDIQRLLHECPQLFCCCGGDSNSSSSSGDTSQHAASVVVSGCTSGWSPHSFEEELLAAAGCDSTTTRPSAPAAVGQADLAAAPAAQAAPAADAPPACACCSSSVYEVGRTLLFFHSLGWSHSSVLRRIIPLYPQLLTKQVERDMLPILTALTDMGCSREDLQLLIWEFPRIFVSSNWRRHIRKFQYLGLYGLPPPGQQGVGAGQGVGRQGSSSSGRGVGVEGEGHDSLSWLMCWWQ